MSGTKKYSQGKFDPTHPTISQSFLNTIEDCAFLAYKRYVEGIIIPPGIAAIQGTATDAAVTAGLQSVIDKGADISLDDKKNIAAEVFEKASKEARVWKDDDLGALKDQTVSLVAVHHREIAPTIKPRLVQEELVLETPDYKLAGTVDIVEQDHTLADTKTSRSKYAEDSVNNSAQAAVYSRLYQHKYGVAPKGFRYDVLVKNKTPTAQRVSGVVTEQNQALLDHRINVALNELRTGIETGVWRLAPEDSWRCASTGKWCGYLSMCPKGKK